MITFHSVTWSEYYNDPSREALWKEHYAEFQVVHEDRMEMGPDVATYQALDTSGALEIVIAREAGKMIGYCIQIIKRHMHYGALCAFEDSYFLTADARLGLNGVKLIKAGIAASKRRGCIRAYWMSKEFMMMETLFERLGMERVDSVFALWLRD